MAIERVTGRSDGETYVDRGGAGVWSVIGGFAVLALVAIIAFFMLNEVRSNRLRASAVTVTGAAATVAGKASAVADKFDDATGTAPGRAAQ